MKKIKKLWMENRVLFVLFTIIIICACIILGVMLNYFFGATKSSYGDRLNGIENVQFTDDIKEKFLTSVENDELIEKVDIYSKGKIIYISFVFKEGASLVEAQSKALASLQLFEQNYLDFYDFHFTLKQNSTEQSEGFLIMGSKNVNGSGLIWNNNTEVSEEE